MKLLFVINSLSLGGAERVTVNLANYWANAGFEIIIVTIQGRDQDFYDIHPDIHRITLGNNQVSANFIAGCWNNLQRFYALNLILRQEKPDIALGVMTTANCLLALAAVGTGVVSLGSERTYPPRVPLGWIWSRVRKITYPLLSAVVSLNQESARWLQAHTKVTHVPVISNPVVYPIVQHEPYLDPSKLINEIGCGKLLIAAGRLSPEKGFDFLVDAFAQLAFKLSDWSLVILGEGECREELEKKVRVMGLDKNVFMPGLVGNVGDWLDAADLYVLTSWFEGFPNILIEALACGVPVVSVDCETGPRDIVRHGIDGFLVPQHDQKSLVEAMEKVMVDSRLRQKFSERAIDARERFSLDSVIVEWEKLFQDVLM